MAFDDIIIRMKKGDKKAFNTMYLAFRPAFLAFFSSKYSLEKEVCFDLYQQTMLQVYENILQGKLDDIQSTLKTYVFGVGKNISSNESRYKKVRINHKDSVRDYIVQTQVEYTEVDKELIKRVMKKIKEMKEVCQKLLIGYYVENKKTIELQYELKFSSEQGVRTQKSRCLNYLRKMIKN